MTDFTGGTWRSLVDGAEVSAIPDSAIAHWKFDDNSDTTTAIDSIGNDDGTITGANYTTAKVGAFSLGFGAVDDNVEFSDGNYHESNDFTTAFWLYLNSIPSNGSRVSLFSPGYDGFDHPPHIIYDNNNVTSGEQIAIRSFDGSSSSFVGTGQAESTGTWVHVAISVSWSDGATNIWIDNTKVVNGSTLNNLTTNAKNYFAGGYDFQGSIVFVPDARLDDIFVCDAVLTDSEVDSLYQRGT